LMRENQPFAYLGRSLYFKQLSVYLKHFEMKRIHVILFDDLMRDPATVFQRTCRFLDIEPEGVSAGLGRVENTSTPPGASLSPALRARLVEFFAHDVKQLAALLKRDLSHWMR